MARVKCKLNKRGKPSVEWHDKDGKPQYYCCGYINLMTDEPLEECQNCRDYVDRSQDDLEEYNAKYKNLKFQHVNGGN